MELYVEIYSIRNQVVTLGGRYIQIHIKGCLFRALGGPPILTGWGCSSYLLGIKILGFATALGVQIKILTFAYNTVPFRVATVI